MAKPARADDAAQRIVELEAQVRELNRQLEWVKRQLFGAKSDRRLVEDNPRQALLNGFDDVGEAQVRPATEDITYTRREGKQRGDGCVTDQGLRFDESVPVETIELSVPEEMSEAFEVIGYKDTYRLAQRPASYVVLHYRCPTVKRLADGAVLSVPAPDGLWRGTMADVSVVAGVLVDKFCYHLPLYRQRQRMGHGGVTVARPTLTNWVHRGRGLLEPIYRAQLRQILQSRTLAIDETPVKAGRAKGKMKTAWYWPIYGEDDEVAFTFAPTRGRAHLDAVLEGFTGTLLCDGASACESFVNARPGLTLPNVGPTRGATSSKPKTPTPVPWPRRWNSSVRSTRWSNNSTGADSTQNKRSPGVTPMRARPSTDSSPGRRRRPSAWSSHRRILSPRPSPTRKRARRHCACT